MAYGSCVHALPQGGVVAAGAAAMATTGATTTVTQSTANAVINWQSFSIAAGQTVQFVQPSVTSVALNRVVGADPSSIFGNLSSNGKVFLVNPNGILFGVGSSVSVGGLVASTLNIGDANFMDARYKFAGPGSGAVVNRGSLHADGGYIALMGGRVDNQGVMTAQMGTVVLAAGNAMTMDIAGDRLLNVTVDQGAVQALVQNGGLIQSDGGTVLLNTQAAGHLLSTVVNNTGVIRAQTLSSVGGTIKLLGDMQTGTIHVGGTLDASAPGGGNGGFIETSAARVMISDGVSITTAAPQGRTGTWLIDPEDFNVGGLPTDNISGANLSALLVNNSVTITTGPGPDVLVAGAPPRFDLHTSTPGNGDININQAVAWSADPLAPTTLTLNAVRDVNINAAVTATEGNLAVCCGRDVNVNAPIVVVRGSVLLSAGRDVQQNAAITVTDGNLTMCAAQDVNVAAAISLTRGTVDPTRSLGLALGLVLSADTDGTGPGPGGGTVVFAPLTPPAAVTGPNAPVTINYNPVSYAAPTSYVANFTLTNFSTLTQHMLVFPDGASKVFDGSTAATLTGLKGAPAGVSLVAGVGSTAGFETAGAGVDKPVLFGGYTLAGANAGDYAFAASCCGVISARTTATIAPAPVVPVPGAGPAFPGGTELQSAGVQLAALSLPAAEVAGLAGDALVFSDAGSGLAGLPLTVTTSPQAPQLISLAPSPPLTTAAPAAGREPLDANATMVPEARPNATPLRPRGMATMRRAKPDRQ
ncbi:MAG: filamentous hemagglutinin N-terminal domain-containing protein [Polaromonas sp.]|nr:filamentous hemagglutinin N-terminal domain-containing protein [Polaromonas sp.]